MCVLLLSHWFVFIHLFVKTQRHCTLTNEIWRHVINGDFVDKPKIAISNFATEILRVSPKAPFYWKLLEIGISSDKGIRKNVPIFEVCDRTPILTTHNSVYLGKVCILMPMTQKMLRKIEQNRPVLGRVGC